MLAVVLVWWCWSAVDLKEAGGGVGMVMLVYNGFERFGKDDEFGGMGVGYGYLYGWVWVEVLGLGWVGFGLVWFADVMPRGNSIKNLTKLAFRVNRNKLKTLSAKLGGKLV